MLARLFSDKVFALNVVVFAEKLKELKGPSVGCNAQLVVQILVSRVRLEDIFPETVPEVGVKVVVVVNGGWTEVVFERLFLLGVFSDVFENKFA